MNKLVQFAMCAIGLLAFACNKQSLGTKLAIAGTDSIAIDSNSFVGFNAVTINQSTIYLNGDIDGTRIPAYVIVDSSLKSKSRLVLHQSPIEGCKGNNRQLVAFEDTANYIIYEVGFSKVWRRKNSQVTVGRFYDSTKFNHFLRADLNAGSEMTQIVGQNIVFKVEYDMRGSEIHPKPAICLLDTATHSKLKLVNYPKRLQWYGLTNSNLFQRKFQFGVTKDQKAFVVFPTYTPMFYVVDTSGKVLDSAKIGEVAINDLPQTFVPQPNPEVNSLVDKMDEDAYNAWLTAPSKTTYRGFFHMPDLGCYVMTKGINGFDKDRAELLIWSEDFVLKQRLPIPRRLDILGAIGNNLYFGDIVNGQRMVYKLRLKKA